MKKLENSVTARLVRKMSRANCCEQIICFSDKGSAIPSAAGRRRR
ncbi:hypothetical protein CLOSTASPAR_03669 [[Clostridium] asparagiforme DSM 15981]|uniref:Uncharacterized protein n=1 Tax=[Clostridium] asparagiforme DSM 15981 TaxID=518636 RepID=C0D328_9FIRM|nr:hypothetical protein CLOSTASPAR_03669 [[Clostridium] asparagiforme DSM 15981]